MNVAHFDICWTTDAYETTLLDIGFMATKEDGIKWNENYAVGV